MGMGTSYSTDQTRDNRLGDSSICFVLWARARFSRADCGAALWCIILPMLILYYYIMATKRRWRILIIDSSNILQCKQRAAAIRMNENSWDTSFYHLSLRIYFWVHSTFVVRIFEYCMLSCGLLCIKVVESMERMVVHDYQPDQIACATLKLRIMKDSSKVTRQCRTRFSVRAN